MILTERRVEKTGLSSVRVLALVVKRRTPTWRVTKLFMLVSVGADNIFGDSGEISGGGVVALLIDRMV